MVAVKKGDIVNINVWMGYFFQTLKSVLLIASFITYLLMELMKTNIF